MPTPDESGKLGLGIDATGALDYRVRHLSPERWVPAFAGTTREWRELPAPQHDTPITAGEIVFGADDLHA